MKAKVTLKEWNGTEYVIVDCSSLSSALAIMNNSTNVILEIIDEDSTGEITIQQSGASPEIIAFNF